MNGQTMPYPSDSSPQTSRTKAAHKENAMKTTWKKAVLAVSLAVSGLSLGLSNAHATNPAVLNLDVTITAAKSVTVNGVASSTDSASVAWSGVANASFTALSQSSVTVANNGVVTEGWELSTNPYTIDTVNVGGSSWAVVSSTLTLPGANQVALQAVFGSSNTAAGGCPAVGSSDWNGAYATPITGSVTQYTSSVYADPSLNNLGTPNPDSGSNLYAGSKRALCWKLIMPNSTSTQDTQNVQVIVTAL